MHRCKRQPAHKGAPRARTALRGEDLPQHRRPPWSSAACALVGLQRHPGLPSALLCALGRAFCRLFDNSNKYERNGNSEEGCHLADIRSQRTNKSDDRSLFTSQVQSVAEERDLRDTLSERGFHSQTLRKVFFKAMLHSFVFL